jgi:hypothetical protein
MLKEFGRGLDVRGLLDRQLPAALGQFALHAAPDLQWQFRTKVTKGLQGWSPGLLTGMLQKR